MTGFPLPPPRKSWKAALPNLEVLREEISVVLLKGPKASSNARGASSEGPPRTAPPGRKRYIKIFPGAYDGGGGLSFPCRVFPSKARHSPVGKGTRGELDAL